jgi:hypothetical protein
MPPQEASKSVVQVTADGRGFVVEGRDGARYVLTAAHCLPRLPEPCSFLPVSERTFPTCLGGLWATAPEVWAECLFVDLVGDIAVLGAPDGQSLPRQCQAYEDFVSTAVPLLLRRVQPVEGGWPAERGWMFALDADRWFSCKVEAIHHAIWATEAAEPIRGGMSGSPILGDDGQVIAVCCASAGTGDRDVEDDREGGPNPGLSSLPGWFLDELTDQTTDPE